MSFFDPFDIARGTTPIGQNTNNQPGDANQQQQTEQQSLNEELNQVVGQLGGLWGRFRKQSALALETARKDLGTVVTQAQRELTRLTEQSNTPVASTSVATPPPTTGTSEEKKEENATNEQQPTESESKTSEDAGKPTGDPSDASARSTSPTPTSSTATSPFQAFLSRVQASVPPNIAATIQQNIPESIRNSTNSLPADFAHLRSTIASELQRVQGVTRAQAEEYVHKSEALLKEAGEFLKDAVKIVPPEETGTGRGVANFMWDGSDVWLIPSLGGDDTTDGDKGKSREIPTYSRAEALLQRLKRDPEVIKVDPASVEQTKDLFDTWYREYVSNQEGGMDSSEWFERIKSVLGEKGEGQVLTETRDSLVPSVMDSQTFWTRYFFRVYQIEKDEEKRKQLLEAQTAESEEDFNWEDEEEDDTSTPPVAAIDAAALKAKPASKVESSSSPRASVDTVVKKEGQLEPMSVATSLVSTPANTSPRESSEASYDVVSAGSARAKSPMKDVDEDGDSDWE